MVPVAALAAVSAVMAVVPVAQVMVVPDMVATADLVQVVHTVAALAAHMVAGLAVARMAGLVAHMDPAVALADPAAPIGVGGMAASLAAGLVAADSSVLVARVVTALIRVQAVLRHHPVLSRIMGSSHAFALGSTCWGAGKNIKTLRPEAFPRVIFCYNISMRDFVESSDNFSTTGGPDYPYYCTFIVDNQGSFKIYAKEESGCDEMDQKIAETTVSTTTPESNYFADIFSSNLIYVSAGLGIAAIISILAGVIINAINKKKLAKAKP